jgi:outer membrane receptor for ferrienterochelin and colicins
LKEGTNSISDYAFFVTSEFSPTSRISIRPGLRVIHNSVYDAPPVVPSINARVGLSDKLDLRLAYARGFRSPSLRELYFDFRDANHDILGNPDLKAEQSHSFTGSLNFGTSLKSGWVFNTALSGFYNDVENLIDFVFDASSPNLAKYGNVARSKTGGINMTGSILNKHWTLGIGGSYTGFFNQYSEEDKDLPVLQWSPEINANAGYRFTKIGLDANLFYKFTGNKPGYSVNSAQEIVLTELEGYHLADFTLAKHFNKMFTLSAGVRNLFDVTNIVSSSISSGVHTPSGNRSIASGRSFFAGLVFNWNK